MDRYVVLPLIVLALAAADTVADEAALFDVELQTVLEHDDKKYLWFHPRAAAVPAPDNSSHPLVVMTLQKHLQISDYYSGLFMMTSLDLGRSWTGPTEVPDLAWRTSIDGETIAVCDVTPGWHAPTGKLLAIGIKVLYAKGGKQVSNQPRAHEVAYAVYDVTKNQWSSWEWLELPDTAGRYYLANAGCCQWLVEPDGTLLVPVYHKGATGEAYSTTVLRCAFDGTKMTLVEEGQTLTLDEVRGVYEPSLAFCGGEYYLTLRNDLRGYVTRSKDGLHFEPIQPWRFDDGEELGSYNTQQHWLVHGENLFLAYTRKGANNDHIMRHRAPLFLAQVDRGNLVVSRATEKVLVPERGATLGNFGASAITANESWVTVGEGVWNDDARARGAKGALYIARILWK